jgi:hypothetical protein
MGPLEAEVEGMADPVEAAWRFDDMARRALQTGRHDEARRLARIADACFTEADRQARHYDYAASEASV